MVSVIYLRPAHLHFSLTCFHTQSLSSLHSSPCLVPCVCLASPTSENFEGEIRLGVWSVIPRVFLPQKIRRITPRPSAESDATFSSCSFRTRLTLFEPPDARTRGPDPLESFLGLLELSPWLLGLLPVPCCLGAYFSGRPDPAGLGASLSGRPDSGCLTRWAPSLSFGRRQE